MVIATRQYADWRDLRFEPFTSPQVGKMLAKMASQIVEALERDQPKPKPAPASAAAPKKTRQGGSVASADRMESSAQPADIPDRPTPKTEPPTRVVDALYRGDHATLTDALAAAKPGDRILVRPGLYRESIVIDKPVEIIDGQGVFEDNDLRGNAKGAWDVSPDCQDKVKRTRNQE